MVAADARDFLDLRKDFVSAVYSPKRVACQPSCGRATTFSNSRSAHHQEVKDVVSYDDALRRVFERDCAILEIGDGYGGGSCTQREYAEKQNKRSGLKKTTEHIRNLKEDGARLPPV